MKYKLANRQEQLDASAYLSKLMLQEAVIEIKRINPNRSLSQNAYLHLILGVFGAELGYSIEEAKTIYKREVNQGIYVYEKNGQKFLKSSADLTTEEMAKTIDKFFIYAGENGIELPLAEDKDALLRAENYIERNKYL